MNKEKQLLITATSVDGISHGIPYPMPILNPVWIAVEAIINAHKSGRVAIMIHNTTDPTPCTDELLSKFLDYGYVPNDNTKPVDKVEVDPKPLDNPTPPTIIETPEVKEEKVEEAPEEKVEEKVVVEIPEEKEEKKKNERRK